MFLLKASRTLHVGGLQSVLGLYSMCSRKSFSFILNQYRLAPLTSSSCNLLFMAMKSNTLKVFILSFPAFTLSVESDSHLIVSTSKTDGASSQNYE